MEEVESVRGKGWVKFEDESTGEPASSATSPDSPATNNQEAPGSLEVIFS